MPNPALNYSEYEDRVKQSGHTVNFWMAEPYWKAAGWSVHKDSVDAMRVRDEDGEQMLPTISNDPYVLWEPCYAGWPSCNKLEKDEFLDDQFIYDPASFHELSGSDRAVFRKNTKHFIRLHDDIVYRPLISDQDNPHALLAGWLVEDQDIYDLDTVIKYLEEITPDRASVLEVDGEPIGLNVWDENFQFINFRYSFVKRGLKYASEYIRLCFYLDMADRTSKPVNDGGWLGNDRLYKFKKKLRPLCIKPIYTWK